MSRKKAVILLSGGLDSATVAALALKDGFEVAALSFDYGQRHKVELKAAARVARSLGIADHRVLSLDLRTIGGSALTDDRYAVPKHQPIDGSLIPVTYVPARNTVFLSLALGLAEVLDAFDLYFGANALDYSGYPDCRPEFVKAFEALSNVATRASAEGRGHFRVHAPLLHLSKAEIIRRGHALGVDYSITSSCYDPPPSDDDTLMACGACDACSLRKRGFFEAGIPDPTRYAP